MENIETLLAALAQTQGFDDDEPVESPSPELGLQNSIPSTEIRGEMGRSQQVGDSGKNGSVAGKPSVVVNHSPPVVVAAASPVIGAGEKRRRGRPPRGSVATKPPPPKRQKQEDEEEDVCFICFDGGSLVLCDRKGCPKAYHPACIKRDESFFQSKAKWNCGWHICSVCQKTSHYMCYTCTYSLCKGCTRDEDYVLVRGNKGFCTICMKTIMLIENKGQANSDSVQVDFDDQSSWEYLFKWYWMTLKEKLSLTLIELTHAKKPWKGAAPMASNLQMNSLHHTAVEGKVSVSCRSSEHLELNKPCEDCNVLQNDRLGNMASDIDSHVKAPNSYPAEDGPSHNKDIEKPSSNDCHFEALNGCSGQDSTSHIKDVEKPRMDRVIDEPRIDKNSDMPGMDKVIDEPINPRGSEEPRMVKVTEEPRMEKVTEEPSIARDSEKPRMDAVSDKPRIGGDSDVRQIAIDANEPSIARDSDNPGISSISTTGISIEENRCNPCLKDSDMPNIAVEDLNKPGICRTSDTEPEKTRISCSAEWASKDLLEFVAHVKNGDTSALSHFDVQNLLLDYIKRNNLRDPRKKSQIVCDLRLKNLFGKARVGHIEMLKLLEFHFLGLEDSHKNSFIPAGFVAPAVSPMEIAGKNCGSTNSRKRKSRKRSEERTPQNNINEYAAIDVHNINLIYLRRNLMENLIENERNFNDKVIGSIVRIRISSENQKPDVHRLVQVLGISKVAKLYKVGDKTTDRMLEVLNLDKKEVVSIDAISSQDFTEDECRRLRQSIRCGLAKLFTVGDIQRKAMQLQSVRINDWLESEILRLTHLRDRASEKGHKKEEYLEKIQLLKSPEERQRRISEVPEIHADPKMNPDYESEVETRDDDDSKSDVFLRSKYLESARNESRPNFPNKKGKLDGSILSRDSRMMGNADASTSQSFEKHVNQVIPSSSRGGSSDQTMPRSGLETSRTTTSIGNASSSNNIETEKLWHYRDPNGKIQGPFSMIQLRKWSTTGLFPPEMRIWTNHEQYDSLLLTDALNGQFHGAPELSLNPSSEPQEHGSTIGTGVREDIHMTGKDIKQSEAALCEKSSVLSDKDTEIVRSDESGSSSWPQCWDLLKDKDAGVDDVQPCIVPPPSSPRKTCVIVPSQDRERDEFKHVPESGENNSSVPPAQNQMSRGPHLQTQFSEVQPGLTSDENLRSLPVDLSLNNAESEFAPEPLPKSPDSVEQRRGIDISDLPSPTPQTSDKQWILQNAEKQECASPDVPVEHIGFLELLNPTPKSTNGDQEGQATETKQSGFMNFLLPNSDPGWSGASSLVGDDIQLPEIADEWCGFSPTSAKRSVQEWHACLVSDSSIKPPEVTNQIPPVSNNDQLSHPMPNMPSWLDMLNEPIELDALGEESVSDLLAEVDLLESQCGFPSPTSSIKFAKELNQDCKDDCFSSIEFSHTTEAGKSDAFSSTGEIQLMSHSSVPCKPIGTTPVDAFDCVRQSTVHSSASSEAETNTPVFSGDPGSEFHPHPNNTSQDVVGANIASSSGLDCTDPGWGTVQGNINLVTVQGNVNLVLGGPGQGMPSLNWGNNPGTAWVNPNMNRSPLNVSLPWDGQRKYSVERYTSPRERGYQGGEAGVGRGRLPWGRQPYNGGGGGGGGGGYSRPIPKGQRVCKFYESGHCKKGAFCDYLHP